MHTDALKQNLQPISQLYMHLLAFFKQSGGVEKLLYSPMGHERHCFNADVSSMYQPVSAFVQMLATPSEAVWHSAQCCGHVSHKASLPCSVIAYVPSGHESTHVGLEGSVTASYLYLLPFEHLEHEMDTPISSLWEAHNAHSGGHGTQEELLLL